MFHVMLSTSQNDFVTRVELGSDYVDIPYFIFIKFQPKIFEMYKFNQKLYDISYFKLNKTRCILDNSV